MRGWAGSMCGLGFALSLGACDGPRTPTQLLVIVDSDIALEGSVNALSQIDVQLMSSDGSRSLAPVETFTLETADGGAAHALPLSFALTPETLYQHSLFRLVVNGRNAGNQLLVQKQTFTAFREGEARVLEVFLEFSCLGNSCQHDTIPGDLTCAAARCGEIPTQTDLRTLEGDGFSDYESPFSGMRQVPAPADVTPPAVPFDAGAPMSGPLDAGEAAPDAEEEFEDSSVED